LLDVRLNNFKEVGLAKGTQDDQVWELCQRDQVYLLTDNRNEDTANSLETIIRTRNSPTCLPVFTISDLNRFRSDREYAEAVIAKLLEYLIDPENLRGTGRLYLP